MINRLRNDRANRERKRAEMEEEFREAERKRLAHEKAMEDAAAQGAYHIEPNSKLFRYWDVNTGSLPVVVGK